MWMTRLRVAHLALQALISTASTSSSNFTPYSVYKGQNLWLFHSTLCTEVQLRSTKCMSYVWMVLLQGTRRRLPVPDLPSPCHHEHLYSLVAHRLQ